MQWISSNKIKGPFLVCSQTTQKKSTFDFIDSTINNNSMSIDFHLIMLTETFTSNCVTTECRSNSPLNFITDGTKHGNVIKLLRFCLLFVNVRSFLQLLMGSTDANTVLKDNIFITEKCWFYFVSKTKWKYLRKLITWYIKDKHFNSMYLIRV